MGWLSFSVGNRRNRPFFWLVSLVKKTRPKKVKLLLVRKLMDYGGVGWLLGMETLGASDV